MKSKNMVALILVVILVVSCFAIPVVAAPLLEESTYWENLTADEATKLLESSNGSKDKSFVLVYYSSGCSYSKKALPLISEYCTQNNVKVYALNSLDIASWYGWSGYIKEYPIEYPLVMAYNRETDQYVSKNRVISKKMLHDLLTGIGFKTTYAEKSYDVAEVINVKIPQGYKEPSFSDVSSGTGLAKAVSALADRGITSGYPDGTFKPNNTISRAEAATFIARTMGLYLDKNAGTAFVDVPFDFWGLQYITAASKKGILNGVGNKMFMPSNDVTYAQILKMIVCMVGKESDATAKGGWPKGYISVAKELNIIDSATYNNLISGTNADKSATRGDVAQYIYNAVQIHDPCSIVSGGKKFYFGMPAAKLDNPDEVLRSTVGWLWYVYGTDTYKDFIALGVADDKVVAFTSAGNGFEYMGYKMGQTISGKEDYTSNLFTDKNANNTVHAVFSNFRNFNFDLKYEPKYMAGESKLIFHLTNAFRVAHGYTPFIWSQKVATVARLHSQDMADRKYFSHYSPEGNDPTQRLADYDITYSSIGENIVSGRSIGAHAYDSWVNSADHRKNLLSDQTYLGVGGGYNGNASTKYYFTQNFYTE